MRRFLLLVCGFTALGLGAQDVRRIEVIGTAEVLRAPDQASITLGVESWSPDLAAARRDNDAQVAKLLTVPASWGVIPADVKTEVASIEPQYEMTDRGQIRGIAGYRVTKTVTVVIRDLGRLEAVLSALLTAGANRLDGVTFGLTDASAETQARVLAVRDARKKAEVLAAEAGVSLGQVLRIAEVEGGGNLPMMKRADLQAFSGGPTLAPGQISISAQVIVWFELRG